MCSITPATPLVTTQSWLLGGQDRSGSGGVRGVASRQPPPPRDHSIVGCPSRRTDLVVLHNTGVQVRGGAWVPPPRNHSIGASYQCAGTWGGGGAPTTDTPDRKQNVCDGVFPTRVQDHGGGRGVQCVTSPQPPPPRNHSIVASWWAGLWGVRGRVACRWARRRTCLKG